MPIKKIFFFVFLIVSSFWVISCGVLQVVDINNQLPAPYEIKAKTKDQTIIFTIRGVYFKDDYPFFNGYNLYYGLTSSRSQILRQKLYVDTTLPTIKDSPQSSLSGIVSTEVSLRQFRYLTEDGFEIRPINLYESYFFIVRPFNGKTSREGSYNNVITEVRLPKKELNVSKNLSTQVVSHESIDFILNTTLRIKPSGGSLIQSAGFHSEDFDITQAPEEGYSLFSQPISEGFVYFFKDGDDFGLLYVRDLNGSQIEYDFFYQQNSRLLL